MKKISIAMVSMFWVLSTQAQVKFGNWMYDNHKPVNIQSSNFSTPSASSQASRLAFTTSNTSHTFHTLTASQTITVKTMYNLKPDAFVAVFSLSQEGEKETEVTELMDARIASIKEQLAAVNKKISLKVDIISFVPVYEKSLEKKIFGKKTFIEKPVGFELKKNIIILFKTSVQMDKIFSICASNQVYDFVRVDFVSTKISDARAALRKTSDSLVKIQRKRHEDMLDIDMDDYNKSFTEGFRVVYPAEKYLNYMAFGGTSYFLKKYNMNSVRKKMTKHYMPILDTEFDMVFNPVVDEPVIQVLYNINYTYQKKPKEVKPVVQVKKEKEFFFVTPTGEVKKLQLD